MAKVYFVITSWVLEDAGQQYGREISPVIRDFDQAKQLFDGLVQREMARLKQEEPCWLDLDPDDEPEDRCETLTDRRWEVWEDGCFDDNHITIELVEAEEDKTPFDPSYRWAMISGETTLGLWEFGVCKVRESTKEVFDITPYDEGTMFSSGFTMELSFDHKETFPVYPKEKAPDGAYWYN